MMAPSLRALAPACKIAVMLDVFLARRHLLPPPAPPHRTLPPGAVGGGGGEKEAEAGSGVDATTREGGEAMWGARVAEEEEALEASVGGLHAHAQVYCVCECVCVCVCACV